MSTNGEIMNLELLKKEENCYTLPELLDLYNYYIKNAMVVISHNYELLYYTNASDGDKVYNESTKSGVWSLELIAIANNAFKNNTEYVILDSINKDKRRLFYKIEHQVILGYLVLLEDSYNTFDNIDYEMLKHLVNSISKILYLDQSKNANRNIQSFYFSLLNNEYKSKDILKAKMEEYNVNLESSLLLISLEHASFTENNYLKLKLQSILNVSAVIAYENNVLIFMNGEGIAKNMLIEFLKENHLTALYVKKIMDYFSFNVYYKALAELLKFLNTSDSILNYESDYKIYLPFFSERFSLDEIKNYIDLKITKIYLDDIKNETDNINTIYHYLAYDKSLAIASKKLFIHKNTVSYRLLKINENYNIDFNDSYQNKIYLYSIFLIKYYHYKINNK